MSEADRMPLDESRRRSDQPESQKDTAEDPRGGWSDRGRGAGASVLVVIARLVMLVAGLIALLIGLGIAFVMLDANAHNTIVSHVHDWALAMVGPFKDMFNLNPPKVATAVNWGLALVVYLVVAWLIASLLRAAAARAAPHR